MYICTCRVDTFRNTCPYFFLIIRMYFLDMYVHINIYIYINLHMIVLVVVNQMCCYQTAVLGSVTVLFKMS
jgi:hypothetical protein